jgi:hypothetical protein
MSDDLQNKESLAPNWVICVQIANDRVRFISDVYPEITSYKFDLFIEYLISIKAKDLPLNLVEKIRIELEKFKPLLIYVSDYSFEVVPEALTKLTNPFRSSLNSVNKKDSLGSFFDLADLNDSLVNTKYQDKEEGDEKTWAKKLGIRDRLA